MIKYHLFINNRVINLLNMNEIIIKITNNRWTHMITGTYLQNKVACV